MLRKHSRFPLAALVVFGVGILSDVDRVSAGILVFSDRASFQANTTDNALEDFNSFTSDTDFAFTDLTTANGLLLSSDGGASVFGEQALIDLPTYVAGGRGVDGTAMMNSRGLDAGQSITVTLPGTFSAIGFDFDNYDRELEGLNLVIDGNTLATIPSTTAVGFLGIVDTMGSFSQVQFVSASTQDPSQGVFNGIDNIEWGNSAVPEPSSIALLGVAAAVTGFRRKRRK